MSVYKWKHPLTCGVHVDWQRALRAAEVIRVFKGNSMISLQINTLGPEGEAIAEARIKKYQPLFRMIGASLRVEEK